jgi:hypothetical protein
MATYIIPRSVSEQVTDLRNSGCSEDAVKKFLNLSVRLGKCTQKEAINLLNS